MHQRTGPTALVSNNDTGEQERPPKGESGDESTLLSHPPSNASVGTIPDNQLQPLRIPGLTINTNHRYRSDHLHHGVERDLPPTTNSMDVSN
jgi:hypothetical protein